MNKQHTYQTMIAGQLVLVRVCPPAPARGATHITDVTAQPADAKIRYGVRDCGRVNTLNGAEYTTDPWENAHADD